MKHLKLLIFIFVLANSCLFAQNKVEFPLWLEGTWEINTQFGISYEKWEKQNDELMTGKTFRIFNQDTIVFDTMKLKVLNNDIILEMSANVKNTRVYAGYKLTQPTPKLWSFDNPLTDSPGIINYWFFEKNRAYVWTQGKNGDTSCMDFVMTKVSDE